MISQSAEGNKPLTDLVLPPYQDLIILREELGCISDETYTCKHTLAPSVFRLGKESVPVGPNREN